MFDCDGGDRDRTWTKSAGEEIKGRSQDPQQACYFKQTGTRAVIKGGGKIVREGIEKGIWHLYHLTPEKAALIDHAEHMPKKGSRNWQPCSKPDLGHPNQ